MATKAAAKPASKSTALAKWDEELARQAEVAAGMEANSGGGEFFGLKSGVLTWQGNPVPGNQMAVVIVDHILETVYYDGEYDPTTPQSPVCFAFGRDEATMTWHENSLPEYAGKLCRESDICQWGSADKGRGKAARETRRLAMIPAGTFDASGKFKMIDDEEHYESAKVGFMKLPVTSVTGYASFVKQVAGALRRPPHGIITKVSVVPDAKSQFKVLFEPIVNVPDEFMAAVMKRNEDTKAVIDFPYTPMEEEAPAPKRGSRAAAKPAPARSKRKY